MMKEKPKRLKGTVLFTVVSVMMVMVVFLLGTLALAATASNRAYSNYQKEQTEYTSRAVLDSVVQAIQDDSDIKKAVLGLPVGSGMTITVDAQDGSDPHEVTVTNNGPGHQSYDPNVVNGTKKGAWLDNNEYLLSVTVGKTMAQTTYTAKLAGVVQPAKQTNNPGGAFVSLGNMDGKEISTHGFTTGGSYVGVGGTPSPYSFSRGGDQTIDGPFYLNGDCTVATNFYMHFTRAEDFMVIMGDLTISNKDFNVVYDGFQTDAQIKDASGKWVYEKFPYVYVDGKLSKADSPKLILGEDGYPLNVYAGSIAAAANTEIHGDLYTFDPVDMSDPNTWGSTAGASALYKWTSATIKRNDESGNVVNGSWFSKGAIKIQGNGGSFQGDIRCEDDIVISGGTCNVEVDGDIVCAGTLTINSGKVTCKKNIYVGTLVLNGGTLDCSGTIHAGEVQGTPPKEVQSIGEKTGSTTQSRWYDNFIITIDNDNRNFTYSYDEHLKVNGVETVTPISETVTETWGVPPEYLTYEDWLNNGNISDSTVSLYKELIAKRDNLGTEATAEVYTKNFYDVKAAYGGKDIYPADYTKTNLKQNKIQQPLGSAYEYPDSPEELGTGTTIYDKDKGEYTIPTYHKDDLPQISVGVMGGTGGSYRLVTKNCVLTGDFNENVYIKADLPITVVLKDVKFSGNTGSGIIINDEKQVTLFIDGTLELGASGNGSAIITECLMNAIRGGSVSSGAWKYSENLKDIMARMKNDITIYQQSLMTDAVHFPNVVIYGKEGSRLRVYIGGLVTAQVRANKMIYEADKAAESNKKITYVTPDTYPGGMEYGAGSAAAGREDVGLIGQLIAGNIVLEANGNWGMLYTTEGQNTCSCCEHCTNDPECKCTCTTCKCKSGSLTPGGTPTDYKVVSYEYY